MSTSRTHIKFWQGGSIRRIEAPRAEATVLDWLRVERGLTGTKEGCNEGDCGACTVVTVRRGKEGLLYEPVNACIQLLPSLDGKVLLTVEDLSRDGALHPVQQALVEAHGTQCGFCTPGFVMAMFALYREGRPALDRRAVNRALAGNLCRCTGYRPIVEATLAACQAPVADAFDGLSETLTDALDEMAADPPVRVETEDGLLAIPRDVNELADLYPAHPDATLVAGATDVGLWVTKKLDRLPKSIFLSRVDGLDTIEDGPDTLCLGAGVTHDDALAPLAAIHPDVEELWERFAGRQVRAVGTVGGNIANGSPIGDSMPVFIALGASLTLQHGRQTREVALEDFFIDYGKQDRRAGEFVRAVTIDKLRPGDDFRCYKVSKRREDDISAVMGAFRFTMENGVIRRARAAFGGMAGTPKRAPHVEAVLEGMGPNAPDGNALAEAVAQDFSPMTDQRATKDYRLRVAAALAEKAVREMVGGESLSLVRGSARDAT